jgi:DNA polymerase III epsilon subunit family exonuclease
MSTVKRKKGKSLFRAVPDYCVIDIETTGLETENCEIIEIAALKYRNFRLAEKFTTLVKPKGKISYFITSLTGINNDMVKNSPDISETVRNFSDFVKDDILIGYNVNFDIRFLYDALLKCHGIHLKNDYIDVLRFARKADLPTTDKKQTTVARYFRISVKGAHRAEKDCLICNEIYLKLKDDPAVMQSFK